MAVAPSCFLCASCARGVFRRGFVRFAWNYGRPRARRYDRFNLRHSTTETEDCGGKLRLPMFILPRAHCAHRPPRQAISQRVMKGGSIKLRGNPKLLERFSKPAVDRRGIGGGRRKMSRVGGSARQALGAPCQKSRPCGANAIHAAVVTCKIFEFIPIGGDGFHFRCPVLKRQIVVSAYSHCKSIFACTLSRWEFAAGKASLQSRDEVLLHRKSETKRRESNSI